MNINSQPSLDSFLHHYVVDIETWSPDIAETGMTVQAREQLSARRGDLSARQVEMLAKADKQAAELFAAYHTLIGTPQDPYGDVAELGRIVDIIELERSPESGG